MPEDYEEQARVLLRDPVVRDFIEVLRANKQAGTSPLLGVGKTPVSALGWKRTTMFGMCDQLAQHGGVAKAEVLEVLRSATVVYLGQTILPVFRTLASKALEALEAIPADRRPVLPPLPFESMFLVEADPLRCFLLSSVAGVLGAVNIKGEGGAEFRIFRAVSDASYLALHTLLTEKVAALREERPNRQFRKQARAAGLPDESVKVLYLRPVQRERGVAGEGSDSDSAYHCRWAVRGHYRNQWYPGSGSHQLLWIDPHLKGPEGAPFKETVRAVVR